MTLKGQRLNNVTFGRIPAFPGLIPMEEKLQPERPGTPALLGVLPGFPSAPVAKDFLDSYPPFLTMTRNEQLIPCPVFPLDITL
jgi:hypothetical protein